MKYIKFFKDLNNNDIALVGGKNASIGEMFQALVPRGIKVPNGFAITTEAYWHLLESSGVKEQIFSLLDSIDKLDLDILKNTASKIRGLIFSTPLPNDLRDEILQAYSILSNEYGMEFADVAVRSSASAEDLPDASFAGQQDTFLSVIGEAELVHYIKACFASLFTHRAISYRESRGFSHKQVALSVGIQKMVRSDKASSGVIFSIDTETGFENAILITSSFGLGENIVGGHVNPDEFYVFKKTLSTHRPIIKRTLGHKNIKMVYAPKGEEKTTKNIPTTQKELNSFSLNDDEVLKLAKYALQIEEHYSQKAGIYRPMDIEWAKDGESNELFIVQARPETVQSQKSKQTIEKYNLLPNQELDLILKGRAIGEKIATGKVHIINDISQMHEFKDGEILVTPSTDPDWEPVMKRASGVITDRGGRTCHAAIVAREIGVSAIVGAINASNTLYNGQEITICCSCGDWGMIYNGALEYEVSSIEVDNIAQNKTKVMMNIGNPDNAFGFSKLPNDGVGLARMELIMLNSIKAHPKALIDLQNKNYKNITPAQKDEILGLIQGYESPKDFFIKKIAEGIGMICAAFYPKPVIVRTNDFKSNEYRNMLGGQKYEEFEENPMLGFRGASRYYSSEYRDAFIWELLALKSVRDEMGLTNLKIMIPFLRTLEEGQKVLDLMESVGLKRGENGLEVYVMCELPVNVMLADEFLDLFDGFSIGSNDLTQLTLGVDRNGASVSGIFDERSPVMLGMFKKAIDACRARGKYCGICGQAPSDYPEVVDFLVQNQITSLSLNPDTVLKVMQRVNQIENKK
ncbi:MAG: pyruvate, water dikinase [Helicobacter sp.]|nr:pyruvate, water dikinase [Helicobacter sp.]